MTAPFTLRNVVVAALLVILALVPAYASVTGNTFLMTLFTRIIILAMAATSLNLFARDMTDLSVFGGWLEASSLQAVNGFFIVLLAPVMAWVWITLGKRQPSEAVKFSIALLFGVAQHLVSAGANEALR